MDKKVVLMATTILVLILLLPGCVSKQALQPFKTQMHTSGYIDINASNPTLKKHPFPPEPTYFMSDIATNKSEDEYHNIFGPPPSYVGGYHTLIQVLPEDNSPGAALKLISDDVLSWYGHEAEFVGQPFSGNPASLKYYAMLPAIGYGIAPSYLPFEYSNDYCFNRMTTVTKFLVSVNNTPYNLPDPRLATCYLNHGVTPVYFFYTRESEHANVTLLSSAMEQTAYLMGSVFRHGDVYGNVGPVMLVIDPKVKYTAANSRKLVKTIQYVETVCPSCEVAFGLDYNNSGWDYTFYKDPNVQEVIQAIWNMPLPRISGDANPQPRKYVFVAADIDSRHFKQCVDPSQIYMLFVNFSRSLKYAVQSGSSAGKDAHPTAFLFQIIIPYVYFNSSLSCGISPLEAAQGYADLFTAPSSFWYGGAIHSAAIYQPMVGDDPLGVLSADHTPDYLLPVDPTDAIKHSTSDPNDIWWRNNHPGNAAFFGYCRAYYQPAYGQLGRKIFPLLHKLYGSAAGETTTISQEELQSLEDKLSKTIPISRIDGVYYYNISAARIFTNDNIRLLENQSLGYGLIQNRYVDYDIYDLLVPHYEYSCLFKPMMQPPAYLVKHARSVGDAGQYTNLIMGTADAYDMDPQLLDVVVGITSDYNPKSVLYMPVGDMECNPSAMSLDELGMGQKASYFVDKTDGMCKPKDQIPTKNRGARCKPCYFGLAPVPYFKGTWYIAHHKKLPYPVQRCGGKAFDPFNPKDNLCAYAYVFNHNLLSRNGMFSVILPTHASDDPDKYMANVDQALWKATFLALNPTALSDKRWSAFDGQRVGYEDDYMDFEKRKNTDDSWFKYFAENGTAWQRVRVEILEAYVGMKEMVASPYYPLLPSVSSVGGVDSGKKTNPIWTTCVVPYASVVYLPSSSSSSSVSPAEQANREESENAEKNKGG